MCQLHYTLLQTGFTIEDKGSNEVLGAKDAFIPSPRFSESYQKKTDFEELTSKSVFYKINMAYFKANFFLTSAVTSFDFGD